MLLRLERLTATTWTWPRLWVAAVTLSAFGPYIYGGIRTEQFSVYLSGLSVAVFGWRKVRSNIHTVAPFILLWSVYFLIALVGGFLTTTNGTQYEAGSLLAGLDNAALPLSMLVLTCYWTSLAPGFDLVRIAAKVLVVAMTFNGFLAITQAISGSLASFTWLQVFWSSSLGTSVATLAAGNGRYSGIFNQPAEAGVAYSLAVYCLLYLLPSSKSHRMTYGASIGAVLTVGGVLTTSKIFLVGGLPFVVYLVYLVLREMTRRARLLLVGAVGILGAALYALITHGVSLRWSGAAMFPQLLPTDGKSLVGAVTAGRFGEGGTLAVPAGEVLDQHRWFGLGFGGLKVSYDSTWLEALIVAGVIGVVLLALVHLGLAARWYALRDVLPRRELLLAGSVVFLVTVASFGIPSLTGNRIATLTWILLGLLVTSRPSKTVAWGRRLLRPAWLTRLFSSRRGDTEPIRPPVQSPPVTTRERPLPPPGRKESPFLRLARSARRLVPPLPNGSP